MGRAMHWLEQEFETFKWVMFTYYRVWLIPIFFFIFCIGILIFLNLRLSYYFETRPETLLSPFMDQIVLMYYERANDKILKRFVMLGPMILFVLGYLKYRKKFWSGY